MVVNHSRGTIHVRDHELTVGESYRLADHSSWWDVDRSFGIYRPHDRLQATVEYRVRHYPDHRDDRWTVHISITEPGGDHFFAESDDTYAVEIVQIRYH